MHRNVKYKDGTKLNYGTVRAVRPSTSLQCNSAPLARSHARITQLLLKKRIFLGGGGEGGGGIKDEFKMLFHC